MSNDGISSWSVELDIEVEIGNPKVTLKCGRTRRGSDYQFIECEETIDLEDLRSCVRDVLNIPKDYGQD